MVSESTQFTRPTNQHPVAGAFLTMTELFYLPPPPRSARAATTHAYATNADKLAATNLQPGDFAEITGEGGRIEQYLGGSIGDDANWVVERNTVLAHIDNQTGVDLLLGDDATICVNGASTGLWLCPTSILASRADGPYFDSNCYIACATSSAGGISTTPGSGLFSPFAIPIVCADRDQHVYLQISGNG